MDHRPDNSTLQSAFDTNFALENITSSEEAESLPYGIPECSNHADIINVNAFYFPEKLIQDLFAYQPTDKFILGIIFPIILAICVLGNSAFLFTIARNKDMRSLTNFYLANLACADLLYAITTGIKVVYPYIWNPHFSRGGPWKTGFGCGIANSAQNITFFASICLVTLVSIERYLAICHPLKHRMVNNKSRTLKMVLTSWLIQVALCLAALTAPAVSDVDIYCILWPKKYQHLFPEIVNFCSTLDPQQAFQDVSSISQFIPFLIALVGNTALYSLIVVRLSQRNVSDRGDDKNGPAAQATRVRNSVARMLVINGIAFFLCLAPFQFFTTYYWAVRNFSFRPLGDGHLYTLSRAGRCLNVVNSAINPVIYGATNLRYRQAFLKAIGCAAKQRERKVVAATSSTAISMVSKTNNNTV